MLINGKKNLIKSVGILLLVVIGSFFLFYESSVLKNFFHSKMEFLEMKMWRSGSSLVRFFYVIFNFKKIFQENDFLNKEYQNLILQLHSCKIEKKSCEKYEKVSQLFEEEGFDLLPVNILGMKENDELIINKGEENGLREGMPIIDEEKILFGKIKKVYKKFSLVSLISSPETTLDVKIEPLQPLSEDNKTFGVLKGKGGLSANLDLIPSDNKIDEGDLIFTSPLSKTFPSGLLIGRVVKVRRDDRSPFQQVETSLFLDIKREVLFVILNYSQ